MLRISYLAKKWRELEDLTRIHFPNIIEITNLEGKNSLNLVILIREIKHMNTLMTQHITQSVK